MRKNAFFSSFTKSIRLALLVLILLLGWALFSVTRLIKGEVWSRNKLVEFEKNNLFGATPVYADAPVSSTPFLAVWTGKEYKIENDFLFGKPHSYFSDFTEGKRNYESGWISPDLLKVQSIFQKKEGKLAFQIQEIEPEESFVNGMTLLNVIHPVDSEVVVDSDYGKFYVLNKKRFLRSFVAPVSIKNKNSEDVSYLANNDNLYRVPTRELPLEENDYIDIAFSGLTSDEKYFLTTKSYYRDWVMGENSSLLMRAQFLTKSLVESGILSKAVLASLLAFVPWLHQNELLIPFIMLGGGCSTGSTGGSAGCSGSGSPPKCLPIYFKDSYGGYRQFVTIEPRAWRSSSEMTEIPREAISGSGDLHLRVSATKRHRLDFVGLAGKLKEMPYRTETLGIKRAWHHRLQGDVTALLRYRPGRYLHTIPGDTVDVEFEQSKGDMSPDMKETHLLRSAGFYTYLSPESKKIAGDWKKKLSGEAKERLSFIEERSVTV